MRIPRNFHKPVPKVPSVAVEFLKQTQLLDYIKLLSEVPKESELSKCIIDPETIKKCMRFLAQEHEALKTAFIKVLYRHGDKGEGLTNLIKSLDLLREKNVK
jgi:hypothetical protein